MAYLLNMNGTLGCSEFRKGYLQATSIGSHASCYTKFRVEGFEV